ncbi:MAG: hypothetical protein ACRD0D_07515 [Acidimicrobiales bacterium]
MVAAVVVALVLALATTTVAAAGHAAETRVRAPDQPTAAVVAASTSVSAGEGRAATTPAAKETVGSRVAPNTADDLARLPVGRRGSPMDVPRGTNSPATIGGRQYGGHALDEMMSEGFTPSVVDDAIRFGQSATGASGRVAYYSSANNVTVIVENGRVVTVSSGYLKPR